MPELPEVETVRRQLTDKLTDRRITDIDVRFWKSVGNDRYFVSQVTGQTITVVDRVGKYLFFTLSEDDSFLICHLRMTGRLIFVSANDERQIGGGHRLDNPPETQPHEHTRVIFTFADGSHLYFNDQRKFGYIKRADRQAVDRQKTKLGPEPMTADYTCEYLREALDGRKTSLKAALLKQSDIAGLGNIYVDEACFRARVRPDREAGSLSDDELQRLYDATQSVLIDALAYGGTTMRNFADTAGSHGNFTDRLAVFGRDGKPCRICGAEIEKIRCGGRGTHLCPQCQL